MEPESPSVIRWYHRRLNPAQDVVPVAVGLIALVLSTAARPHSPVDPAATEAGHPTGHVHDHADETWPPQPRGMKDSVLLDNAGGDTVADQLRERRAQALESSALSQAQVRAALGTRFARAALIEDTDKSGAIKSSRLVYFSHSKNVTVELALDGQTVRGVKSVPATVYQPEITDQEIAQAEAIARAHFTSIGEFGVAQLQAFGILAYLPSGTGFYATRVLYISFHSNSDAPPEYAAWVDLSRQRVLRVRKERP